jgi:hypothetical protein
METETVTIVVLAWAELILAYFCMKKAKLYGYPNWTEQEASPIVRHFIRELGRIGLFISMLVNPAVFLLVVDYVQNNIWEGTSFSYVLIGFLLFLSYSNYRCWRMPAELYNEKIYGEPIPKVSNLDLFSGRLE